MWEVEKTEIESGVNQYRIRRGPNYLSYRDWIELLKSSTAFVEFYVALLKASQYAAYFWEVKPLDEKSVAEPFEFVLVESSSLPGIKANPSAFSEHFKQEELVVTFPNLGGDAQLIVPTPLGEESIYNHLASFVRSAPQKQILEFWKKVGEEYDKKIGQETKWLSTAGLGVYWLHVRIDSRPKYYRFKKYKN